MTDYKLYPNLPWGHAVEGPSSAPLPENPQVAYHLIVIQAKRWGLINKQQKNRLVWLNACSSGISIATGISSVATFATFIGLPVSISLGAASLTWAIASGIISALTKKYQKTLKKATKFIDMVTPALVVFERVVSGALKNAQELNDPERVSLRWVKHLYGLVNELNNAQTEMIGMKPKDAIVLDQVPLVK